MCTRHQRPGTHQHQQEGQDPWIEHAYKLEGSTVWTLASLAPGERKTPEYFWKTLVDTLFFVLAGRARLGPPLRRDDYRLATIG